MRVRRLSLKGNGTRHGPYSPLGHQPYCAFAFAMALIMNMNTRPLEKKTGCKQSTALKIMN